MSKVWVRLDVIVEGPDGVEPVTLVDELSSVLGDKLHLSDTVTVTSNGIVDWDTL